MGDARVKTIFYGTEKSKTEDVELVCYVNSDNQIFIQIEDTSEGFAYDSVQFICLDKATAIKLHRELKKQISFIEEGGENE